MCVQDDGRGERFLTCVACFSILGAQKNSNRQNTTARTYLVQRVFVVTVAGVVVVVEGGLEEEAAERVFVLPEEGGDEDDHPVDHFIEWFCC